MPVAILDLRERPEFFEPVADRIWHAWWKDRGFLLDHISSLLRETVDAPAFPFCRVAEVGGVFAGTVSMITSDMEERARLTPWLAALWVDPPFRRRGIAKALIDRVLEDGFALGFDTIHLCAIPENHGFYRRLGWTMTESGIGKSAAAIFVRHAADHTARVAPHDPSS